MKEFEKEFYANLGFLSTQFAKMEYKLSFIIGQLMGNDESLITLTLIENNTLHQNIELLKKISKIRDVYTQTIADLILKIQDVKSDRNLFIHGIWHEPNESEKGFTKFMCEEIKLKRTEDKDDQGKIMRTTWTFNQHYIFDLPDFKKRIKSIEDIIKMEDLLIKTLENETFN